MGCSFSPAVRKPTAEPESTILGWIVLPNTVSINNILMLAGLSWKTEDISDSA